MIESLPRREREIFEILSQAGEATAAQVRDAMADPPSYSAVRTMLARLEVKGLASHRTVDQAYVYACVPGAGAVRDSVMRGMVRTFFNGSAASAATALLGLTTSMSAAEIEALQRAIDEAKERRE